MTSIHPEGGSSLRPLSLRPPCYKIDKLVGGIMGWAYWGSWAVDSLYESVQSVALFWGFHHLLKSKSWLRAEPVLSVAANAIGTVGSDAQTATIGPVWLSQAHLLRGSKAGRARGGGWHPRPETPLAFAGRRRATLPPFPNRPLARKSLLDAPSY